MNKNIKVIQMNNLRGYMIKLINYWKSRCNKDYNYWSCRSFFQLDWRFKNIKEKGHTNWRNIKKISKESWSKRNKIFYEWDKSIKLVNTMINQSSPYKKYKNIKIRKKLWWGLGENFISKNFKSNFYFD